jgi:hypothetical protein
MAREWTERDKMHRKLWAEKHPRHNWANTVIHSHRARGIDVRLSYEELIAFAETKDRCAYCETPLNWNYGTKKGRVQYNSPTADRINNERFLDLNNIRIVCYRCNMTKGEGTMDEFISYCKRIAQLSDLRKTTSN